MPHLALSFFPCSFYLSISLFCLLSLSAVTHFATFTTPLSMALYVLSFPSPFLSTQPSPHSSFCITGGFCAAVQFVVSLHSLLPADANRALPLSSSICFTVGARPPRTDSIISISSPLAPFNASPPNYCRHLIQPFANESSCARKYCLKQPFVECPKCID